MNTSHSCVYSQQDEICIQNGKPSTILSRKLRFALWQLGDVKDRLKPVHQRRNAIFFCPLVYRLQAVFGHNENGWPQEALAKPLAVFRNNRHISARMTCPLSNFQVVDEASNPNPEKESMMYSLKSNEDDARQRLAAFWSGKSLGRPAPTGPFKYAYDLT